MNIRDRERAGRAPDRGDNFDRRLLDGRRSGKSNGKPGDYTILTFSYRSKLVVRDGVVSVVDLPDE